VLAVGALGTVVIVVVGVLVLAGVVRDVHRARAAADLAALAAAVPLIAGGGVDCSAAASVATANGAMMTGCGAGSDSSVAVSVSVGRAPKVGWGLPAAVTARARAGLVVQPP
jgi:secretion/DNA translocation related TadE-like protein